MSATASIGFALIARDAGQYLEKCLQSIRPYAAQIVVGVDALSKDKTLRIAKKYADVVFPVKVSDWHECEAHGRIMVQHFARARNDSFSRLDPSLDFHSWIDADDVLENAQLLPAICKQLPGDAIGVWSPYHYAYVLRENGQREVNTVFHRERLLRTRYQGQPVKWEWQHRIHEVVAPVGLKHPRWIQNNDLIWVHQHQAHKSENSAPRNLTCLEVELEENHDDQRTLFYMGNTYFALNDWQRAIDWYEEFTARHAADGNPYEVWQSFCYLSRCYEKMGDVGASLQACFGAINARPEHPEPYWQLAAIYAQTEQPDKAIYWSNKADECPEAPFFAFKNPMDRSFNKYLPLADAYLQLKNLEKAKECWDLALQAFPEPLIQEKAEWAARRLLAQNMADHFNGMAGLWGEEKMLEEYQTLPDPVKSFGRVRNLAMTSLRVRRTGGTQPKIIFWCGRAAEPWSPASLNTTGIGGSETAVVEIAKRFARTGWLVDVYCGADFMEGEYEGVGYWDPERLRAGEECDVLVSWRNPAAHNLPVKAKQKVLWCHDLNYGPGAVDLTAWDLVLGVSQWHELMLVRYYGPPTGAFAIGYVPNGIDLTRFERVKKVPFRCVYASSPDRGLARLLSLWPAILRTEPQAELHVGYGWETMDKMIAGGRHDLAQFKAAIIQKLETTERVVWRGRLPQTELAQLYAESELWLYPTDFLEVSCISAMEAMAGGAVPVTTKAGALPETISGAGLLVPAPTTSRGYQDTYLNVVRGLLTDVSQRMRYAEMGRGRARNLTWDKAFERWLHVLGVDVAVEQAA